MEDCTEEEGSDDVLISKKIEVETGGHPGGHPLKSNNKPISSTNSSNGIFDVSEITASPVNMLQAVAPKEESVNMVSGNWRREEKGWVQVRSIMDSGCGASVAPPGMCPTYPIEESEGSRRGQEFMSASENTMPNLGEQKLEGVLDSGRPIALKYQIADVSRALNAVTEICDAGHHVIFGKKGGVIVNLESGRTTPFEREGNIYVLSTWIKPFTRQAASP